MLSAAVEISQTHPEPSEAPSVSDARKKKPAKKSVAGPNLKEVRMDKATKIECHITKYPTAILMQNMEFGRTSNAFEQSIFGLHQEGCHHRVVEA